MTDEGAKRLSGVEGMGGCIPAPIPRIFCLFFCFFCFFFAFGGFKVGDVTNT